MVVSGGASAAVSHEFAATGNFSVQVVAIDKDGGRSAASQTTVNLSSAMLQNGILFVGGSSTVDTSIRDPGQNSGVVRLTVNGQIVGNYHPTTWLVVYGGAGNDNV